MRRKKIVCERKSLLSKANVAKQKKELQVKIAKGFKGTFLKVITFSPLKMRIPWLSLVLFSFFYFSLPFSWLSWIWSNAIGDRKVFPWKFSVCQLIFTFFSTHTLFSFSRSDCLTCSSFVRRAFFASDEHLIKVCFFIWVLACKTPWLWWWLLSLYTVDILGKQDLYMLCRSFFSASACFFFFLFSRFFFIFSF